MTISRLMLGAVLVGAFGVAGVRAAPMPPAKMTPASGVTVRGDVAKPGTWTLAQIQKLAPAHIVSTTLKGKPFKARGIPLRALIEAAKVRLDPKAKHPEAHYVVLVRGTDGYTASFAWPELLPDVGGKTVLVAWEVNGKPLGAKEGPLRLVVPGETKPMRWVYNLASVQVLDGTRYPKE